MRRFAAAVAVLGGARPASPEAARDGAYRLLDALGVRLDAPAAPLTVPGAGTLIVADHISWLDVPALAACAPVTLLAKREVAGWPVIGPLARRLGTCFIDRDDPYALPGAVAEVARLLSSGRSVVAFPQATTWCGPVGGRFRRATFQAAVDAGAPVLPVTVDYTLGGEPTTVAAFVGTDGFLASLARVVRADGLTVRIRPHQPLWPGPGIDRRALAAAAERTVFGRVAPGPPRYAPRRPESPRHEATRGNVSPASPAG
ncbi:MAG: 1-acyl-sn-glycerol-3-phosphate acyltransferase [Streptosporangiales bacterium]|nr:1-acyl-sn-glycerol-3-phosphate acyltransferase [Streptosporangiales bacterium]